MNIIQKILHSSVNIPIGAVILLQIVMVSPGTHFVKNHESPSRSNESQFKKKNHCRFFRVVRNLPLMSLYRVMSLLHNTFVNFKYNSSQ